MSTHRGARAVESGCAGKGPGEMSFRFTPLEEIMCERWTGDGYVTEPAYPGEKTPSWVWDSVRAILDGKRRFRLRQNPTTKATWGALPKPKSLLDKRGARLPTGTLRKGEWLFTGWTHDQDAADAYAAHIEEKGEKELARLVRLTPAHNQSNDEMWAKIRAEEIRLDG